MRTYIRSVAFMVVLTGAALAYNNGSTKPESAEHRFARQQYDNQVEVVAGLSDQIEKILADVDAPSKDSLEVHHIYVIAQLNRGDKLAIQMGVEEKELAQRELRLEHADECVTVFHATIDKKNADTATRDTEQVKACQSMNLYPPAK